MMEKISDILMYVSQNYDSNCYVVFGSKNTFLVDAGSGLDDTLLHELKKSGVHKSEIDFIICTHCHFDHTGGLRFFDVPVYLHENDARWLKAGDSHVCAADMFGEALKPRENINILGSEIAGWQVMHTPGHTTGSICLYKDNILISGDTLFSDGNTGRMDLPTGSEEDMEKSIGTLSALRFDVLLPGHGFANIEDASEILFGGDAKSQS